jgi:hypothetical protein
MMSKSYAFGMFLVFISVMLLASYAGAHDIVASLMAAAYVGGLSLMLKR